MIKSPDFAFEKNVFFALCLKLSIDEKRIIERDTHKIVKKTETFLLIRE